MQIKEALQKAAKQIKKSTESPTLDSEILLAEVLRVERIFLYAHPEKELSKSQELEYFNLTRKRAKHKPLAYLQGYKEFYGYKFKVDERVLIPRPETEEIVDLALNSIKKLKQRDAILADICSGSGCVGISIAKKLLESSPKQQFTVYLSDISPEALQVARINARALLGSDYSKHIKIIKSDLLTHYTEHKINIDILTANPPYISDVEYKKLDRQISQYEPKLALLSGRTHDAFVKKILDQTNSLPEKPTNIFIESKDGKILVL